MIGLAEYVRDNNDSSLAKVCDSILKVKENGLMALLLDQIYLCARFNVRRMDCPGLIDLTKWSADTYSELGNSERRWVTEEFLIKLNGEQSLPPSSS
jgi:hypothetical protein